MKKLKYIKQADMNGKCKDEQLHWDLQKECYVLEITGKGAIPDFGLDIGGVEQQAPWAQYRELITGVVIHEGITGIGSNAFAGCEMLSSVILPQSMERISYKAFYGCSALEKINAKSDFDFVHIYEPMREEKEKEQTDKGLHVIKIGLHVFTGTPYAIEKWGDFYCCDDVLVDYWGKEESVQIPEGITKIGTMAFCECNIRQVRFPKELKEISSFAFSETQLEMIELTDGVEIGYAAFSDIPNRLEIQVNHVEKEKRVTTVNENVFLDTQISFEGKKKLPDIYKLELKPEMGIRDYKRLKIKREDVSIGNERFNAGNSILRRIERGARVFCITYDSIEKMVISVDCYAWEKERDLPKKTSVMMCMKWVRNEEIVNIEDIFEECLTKAAFLELFPCESVQRLYEWQLIREETILGKEEWYWEKGQDADDVTAACKLLYQWMKKHKDYCAKRQ